jgi:hypothetical protein
VPSCPDGYTETSKGSLMVKLFWCSDPADPGGVHVLVVRSSPLSGGRIILGLHMPPCPSEEYIRIRIMVSKTII